MLEKINLGLVVLLLGVSVWLGTSLQRQSRAFSEAIQKVSEEAELDRNQHQENLEATRQQLASLKDELSGAKLLAQKTAADLGQISARVKRFEAEADAFLVEQRRKAEEEKHIEKLKAEVPTPSMTVLTTSAGQVRREVVFPKLVGSSGLTLMENAEFRDIYGSKVVFQEKGGLPKSYSVMELHPGVLEHLVVNAAEAIEDQKERDLFKEKIKANMAKLYQAKLREDQAIVARKARAEEYRRQQSVLQDARLAQIEVEQTKADIERIQAQAELERSKAEQMLPAMLQGIGNYLTQ